MSDAANRVIYRLQMGGFRLCEELQKIAEYENDDNETVARLGQIARRALNKRAPDDFSQMEAFHQFQQNAVEDAIKRMQLAWLVDSRVSKPPSLGVFDKLARAALNFGDDKTDG